jgi:pimeloyl-ACP methyl ester carboxylesterase
MVMRFNGLSYILLLLALVISSCAYTPRIRSSSGEVLSGSIAEEFPVSIGGIRQYMLVRGNQVENPILLYIHGGPGKCEMPLQRIYNSELEEYFTVITWDQRGAGKTNRLIGDVKDFSIKAYLSDTNEVIQYIKKRFNRERIFLVGHSWGALLGILTARDHPDDLFAFVGIGQVTGLQQNIGEAYQKALRIAGENGNRSILRKLASMNDDIGNFNQVPLADIIYIRKYINRHAENPAKRNIYSTLVWKSIWSPEYTLLDVTRAIIGISGARNFLKQNDLREIDMFEQVKKLEVPYFVVSGVSDLFTDPVKTREYVDFVQAPYKKFTVFEGSTHHPNYEEVSKYNNLLINEVRQIGLEWAKHNQN